MHTKQNIPLIGTMGLGVTLATLTGCGSGDQKEKGGLVIDPTHMVEPEVPWENLAAIIEGVNKFQQNRN